LRETPEEKPLFAEFAYAELIKKLAPEDLVQLRTETRMTYIDQMRELLGRIKVPKILLYWSTRQPNYAESTTNVGSYMGAFPHFVNDDVIDALEPHADEVIRVVGGAGLPQPLVDRETGEPVEMWPEDKFPLI